MIKTRIVKKGILDKTFQGDLVRLKAQSKSTNYTVYMVANKSIHKFTYPLEDIPANTELVLVCLHSSDADSIGTSTSITAGDVIRKFEKIPDELIMTNTENLK